MLNAAPPADVAQEVLVPSVVKNLPELLVCDGANALNAAFAVVWPVPPFAIANVPARVIAPVVPVDGVKPVVPALKDVTPPVDADHVAVVPLEVKT